MSGDRRECSSTVGSIFFAMAKASALSRMADSALRLFSKTGSAAWDIENGMVRFFGLAKLLWPGHRRAKHAVLRTVPGHDDIGNVIRTNETRVSITVALRSKTRRARCARRAASSGSAAGAGAGNHPGLHRQQALALQLLAGELTGAADGFGLLAHALLGRLFVMAAQFHLAEHALALHFLLQYPQRLVDIVVTDENLHAAFLFVRAVDGADGHGARAVGAWRYSVSRGSRSITIAAPLCRRGWRPSWIRKKPRSARSDWSGRRDKSPSATASAAAPGSLRQPKNRHDRSWPRTLAHNTVYLADKKVV